MQRLKPTEMTREEFEELICDKLGMFTNGSVETLAEELERLFNEKSLPSAEGAKTCWNCGAELRYSPNGVTAYHCACGAVNPGERPQPTAEGAEEIFQKHRNEPYGIFRAMEEYATLHAQKMAEKMVEEKLREELALYHRWIQKNKYTNIIHSHHECAAEYLKSRLQRRWWGKSARSVNTEACPTAYKKR